MIREKIFLIFILLNLTSVSFAQKKTDYYLMQSFFKGVSFYHSNYDITFNDENKYISFILPNDSSKNLLLQAKLFPVENKNDIFLVITYEEDMQCSWCTFNLYEIENQTDSLIQIPFHSLIPQFSIGEFIDTAKIHQEIYPKYIKDLEEYLGEENPFNQFLEEMFDVKYKISAVDNKLTATLHYCDYMSLNIIGFSEEDEKYLTTSKFIELDWDKSIGKFAQ